MRVLSYVISDPGRYSMIGYPDIWIPIEITNHYIINYAYFYSGLYYFVKTEDIFLYVKIHCYIADRNKKIPNSKII